MEFEGKNVVITGGLGCLGRVTAERFLREGGFVWALDLPAALAAEEANALAAQWPERLQLRACDVTDPDEIEAFAVSLDRAGIRPDVLVNNAGINRLVPVEEVTPELWDEVVDVNLRGAFFMSRAMGRRMLLGEGGAIVNVASQHGVVGNVKRAPYCASKGGLVNLSRALCLEWAECNIRVNSVLPTFMLTEKNREMLMKPGIVRTYLPTIPLGRYCVPEDVAEAILFLSSDRASMITGQALAVDGGYLAR